MEYNARTPKTEALLQDIQTHGAWRSMNHTPSVALVDPKPDERFGLFYCVRLPGPQTYKIIQAYLTHTRDTGNCDDTGCYTWSSVVSVGFYTDVYRDHSGRRYTDYTETEKASLRSSGVDAPQYRSLSYMTFIMSADDLNRRMRNPVTQESVRGYTDRMTLS